MRREAQFFDFAAEVGLTKHLGGLEATEILVDLCRIRPGRRVLDVGCGAGQTPVYLAKQHGCHVVGVDILPQMVARSAARAKRAGVAHLTTFRVADAQGLPFDENHFHAVITESVTVFQTDKQRAVNEYARVTKPGGYVGLNESTWLQTPPPPAIASWASQELGAEISPETPNNWAALLRRADLTGIVMKSSPISIKAETQGILKRYGCLGMTQVLWRALRLYLRSADYRAFVRRVRSQGVVPENITDYFGYGIYVGRKPKLRPDNSRAIASESGPTDAAL